MDADTRRQVRERLAGELAGGRYLLLPDSECRPSVDGTRSPEADDRQPSTDNGRRMTRLSAPDPGQLQRGRVVAGDGSVAEGFERRVRGLADPGGELATVGEHAPTVIDVDQPRRLAGDVPEPAGVPSVWICVDEDDAIAEFDETNNTRWARLWFP